MTARSSGRTSYESDPFRPLDLLELRKLERPEAAALSEVPAENTPVIAIDSTPVNLDDVRATVRATQAEHRETIEAFHKVYYRGYTWSMTMWMGVPLMKHPCDLFALQDILTGLKPALIVETGTAFGGSALFLAHLCDLIGAGHIITIDMEPSPTVPRHPRITYRVGDSSDPEIVDYVRDRAARCGGPVVVILDSDHHEPHVTKELAAYAPIVTPASFLIVEDMNINGHPVFPEFGPGPTEAVAAFLADHPEFQADALPERYLVTMHPGGWLRRMS